MKNKLFSYISIPQRICGQCISFFAGVAVGTLFLSFTVFASNAIIRASFNDSKIIFDGQTINLNGEKMISVVTNTSNSADMYIPMRAALEGMGFNVSWDSTRNAVVIKGE